MKIMNLIFRKGLVLLLALCMLVSASATVALADEDPSQDDIVNGTFGSELQWALNLDTGILTVSGSGKMPDQTQPWDGYLNEIKKVVLTNGVTAIGQESFAYCEELISVSVPDGVVTIGDSAFKGCSALSSIQIPDSVRTIGEAAFHDTAYFNNSSNWKDGLLYIGKHLIAANQAIKKAVVKSGTKTIAAYAFQGCYDLITVSLPTSLVTVGTEAFQGTYDLAVAAYGGTVNQWKAIDIQSGNNYLLKACNPLQAQSVAAGGSKTVTRGADAKRQVLAFTPQKDGLYIFEIQASDYGYCSVLDKNYNKLVNGYNRIFYTCKAQNPYYIVLNPNYSGGSDKVKVSVVPVYNSNSYQYAVFNGTDAEILKYSGKATTLIIPEKLGSYTVTSIAYGAFSGSKTLQNVTVPKTVKSIGEFSFYSCKKLKTATISSGVKTVKSGAFANCSALSTVKIPGSVTAIESSVFSNCTSLNAITLPSTLTTISSNLFSGCAKLKTVNIPAKVTTIGGSAFSGCKALPSITLPTGLKTIEWAVFSDCKSLKSIVIPKNVASIGGYVFNNCTALTSVKFLSNATFIEDYAFRNCTSLSGITLPTGLQYISDGTFYGCKKIESITLPANVTTIGDFAFANCVSVTEVPIPKKVTDISYKSFSNCTGLMKVSIPKSVTSISIVAFDNCSSLPAITVESGNANYVSRSGVLYTKDKKTLVAYPAGKADRSYSVPSGTTTIMDFNSNKYLNALIIPTSVTVIYDIPKNVTTLYYAGSEKQWKKVEKYYRNLPKLKIKFNAVNTYTLSYSLDGGKQNDANKSIYTKTTATFILKNPTKKGYTFKGWYSEAGFKNKVTQIKKGTTGNKILYAKWEKVSYKISYNLYSGKNNTKNPKTYTITSNITLKKPTRKGYTFKGWYSDAKFKKKVTKITEGSTGNKTLYAKWSKNTYQITYKLNKGKNSSKNPKTYTVTSSITLKNPTRKGYTFAGWYSDAKCKKKVTKIAKGSTGNKTLYAKWKKK